MTNEQTIARLWAEQGIDLIDLRNAKLALANEHAVNGLPSLPKGTMDMLAKELGGEVTNSFYHVAYWLA